MNEGFTTIELTQEHVMKASTIEIAQKSCIGTSLATLPNSHYDFFKNSAVLGMNSKLQELFKQVQLLLKELKELQNTPGCCPPRRPPTCWNCG